MEGFIEYYKIDPCYDNVHKPLFKGGSELLTDPGLSEVEKKKYIAIIQTKTDVLTVQVDQFYELLSINSLDDQLKMGKLF